VKTHPAHIFAKLDVIKGTAKLTRWTKETAAEPWPQAATARLRPQAMNRAIATYWQAAATQTQAWKTSW
jgi:hypothetical protein